MQRLKRLPLLRRLENTLDSLTRHVETLTAELGSWSKPLMMGASIVTCLLILSMCSGCSPKIVKPQLPPQADARSVPAFTGRTHRDVILYVLELRQSCLASEADKAAIRQVFK